MASEIRAVNAIHAVHGNDANIHDGSVRFVDETIDLNIWQALSTPEAVHGEPAVGEF
ncbi:hypothetical protein OAS39_01630 [Pirellulales bacterium]|nr:hypothetical protein [Pirellulales bacterium]